MLRELLTPNIQRIKSICAIGAMLQQVLLWFGIFSVDLFLRKPFRPRSPPALCMARIRSSLFCFTNVGCTRQSSNRFDFVLICTTFGGWSKASSVACVKNLGWWASIFHHVAWGCRDTHLAHSSHDAQTHAQQPNESLGHLPHSLSLLFSAGEFYKLARAINKNDQTESWRYFTHQNTSL